MWIFPDVIFADSSGVVGSGGGNGPNVEIKNGATGGTPVFVGCIPTAITVTNVSIATSQRAGLAGMGVSGNFVTGSRTLFNEGKSANCNAALAGSKITIGTMGEISFE